MTPYELWAEETWDVYDPGEARVVATFYDEAAAVQYLEWINESGSVCPDS